MTKPLDIYLRISMDAENDAEGVARQKREIVAEAKRRDLKIGKTITDNDTSATSGVPMPGRDEIYERMRTGQSGGVIVYHVKRLLRRVIDMEALIELVEETDARIVTLKSSELDLSTASGRAVARVFAAFGEMEVDELKERLRSYFQDRSARGLPHARGRRPFGWNDDWMTLHTGDCQKACLDEHGNKRPGSHKHPNESELYRELFQRVIDGHSLNTIADEWAERGILNAKGKRYAVDTLYARINALRAVGRATYNGQDVGPGLWEPIVTRGVQQAAQAALKARRQRHLRRVGPKRSPQLLSTIAVCGETDHKLRVGRSGGALVYVCYHPACKSKVTINCDVAELEVEARFLARLTDPKTHAKLEKVRRQAPDTASIVDEIERIQLEIQEAAIDKGDGRIDRKTWLEIHDRATARLADAKQRLAAAGDSPVLLAANPDDTVRHWNSFDLDEKRRRLAPWISAVRVMPLNGGGGRNFRPERVKVEWRV